MAHNARRYSDDVYVPGYVVTGDDFKFFDTNLTKAINGDGGGTWNPAAAIVIGGAGLWLGLATTLSGSAHTLATNLARIEHDDDDYIQYSVTRTVASPIVAGIPPRNAERNPWAAVTDGDSLLSPAGGGANIGFAEEPWRFPIRVHNGATMTAVHIVVGLGDTPRAAAPQNALRFRVLRVDEDGNEDPIGTAADADGYVAFSGNYASGALQTIAYACSEVIDTSKYAYRGEIVDEYGAHAFSTGSNAFGGATAVFVVTTMAPQ